MVGSYIEKFEETDRPVDTPNGTEITTRKFERTVSFYDDESKSFSDKKEVDKETKLIKKEDEIKEVKIETKERMNENGEKEKLSKSFIIYKNGKTQLLEDWHVECIIPSMESLKKNNTRSLKNTTTEKKIEIEEHQEIVNKEVTKFKGVILIIPIFGKDTETSVKKVKYKVTYERTVEHFSDDSKIYGEWRKVNIEKIN